MAVSECVKNGKRFVKFKRAFDTFCNLNDSQKFLYV